MLRNTRTKLVATLVAALALSSLVFAAGAGAQRAATARQANQNTRSEQSKRVIVGRGSESRQGSRVTITADDSLKDYSAYRSGDRFYVVLPKSAAGAGARGGSGRGYSDMQVQQRGDSVVLSYRVQPGAKPRVEQKFNRLDVVFDVSEGGGQQPATTNDAGRTQQPPPAENRTQTPPAQQSSQTAAAQTTSNSHTAAQRVTTNPAEAARTQAASAANAATTPPAVTAEQPSVGADPNAQPGATPATALAQEGSAAQVGATPPVEPQLAQAQPPAATAPVSITKPATGDPTGASLGTFLLRNWALTLILALVVVGLGLVIAARRTTAAKHEPVEGAAAAVKPDEPRTVRVKEASAAAQTSTLKASTSVAAEVSSVDTKPLAVASALVGGAAVAKSRKQSRKEARLESKKKKGAQGDSPTAEETLDAAPAVQETVVEETVPVAEEAVVEASGESAVEEFAATQSVVEEPAVEESAVEETGVVFADLSSAEPAEDAALPEPTAEAHAFVESPAEAAAEVFAAPAVEEVESPEAVADETSFDTAEVATVETEAASLVTEIAPVVPEALEPTAAAPEAAEAETSASVSGIEPAYAPEPERVQAETRLLLEGGEYDRGVIATRDPVARQMIAAELLSALAGRNPQRRERAGVAFVEQGFYDETARDLREADAPAERAAAARSLALLGDRTATPLLINALEDPTLDVRRAAVEALGALRDPAAVAPLEALLERERTERNRIPPRIIRVAADSCRDAAAELAAELAAAESAPAAETPGQYAVAEPEATTEVAPFTEAEQVSETATAIEPVAEVEQQEVAVEHADAAATVEIEPVAEASAHTAEPFFSEDARTEVEETFAAEAPVAEAGVDPFVADLSEELTTAAEWPSFETAVAEPQAVVETEEQAEEVSDTVAEATAEKTALEPFNEPTAEAPPTSTPEPAAHVAESGQAALFDDRAAEEVTREVAPFHADQSVEHAASGDEVAAGEWFDFDMQELRKEPQPAETAPPPAPEHIFESSGETFTSDAEAYTKTAAVAEPPSFADARAELTRDVEAYGAEETELEEAAPVSAGEKGVAPFDEFSTVPASIQQRLASRNANVRATAIVELSRVDTDEAFQQICAGFDDTSGEVRSAAARALYELRADRAESFTRALREASPERRREIGIAISASGLAGESISQLTGEGREKTYEAFSLLFLMAKAGEVQPLVRAIETHPSNEVRLAVVKLLALSGQKEILPAFRRLAVRGSLPTEVRSAVMEAIYQISSSQPTPA